MSDYIIRPIGRVQSSLRTREEAPPQGRQAGLEAEIIVEESFAEGLDGVKTGDKLFVLCWYHMADRDTLRVHPRRDRSIPKRGVFSTRSPDRPNPVALCRVDVLGIEGRMIRVRGLDALDGTPVVDIKPYVEELDAS